MAGTPPAGQTCANCKYMVTHGTAPNQYNQCQYSGPDNIRYASNWPQVLSTDWCGQWASTPPTGQSCANCKYVIQHGSSPNQYNQCQLNIPTGRVNAGGWPIVLTTDWCGQWLVFT